MGLACHLCEFGWGWLMLLDMVMTYEDFTILIEERRIFCDCGLVSCELWVLFVNCERLCCCEEWGGRLLRYLVRKFPFFIYSIFLIWTGSIRLELTDFILMKPKPNRTDSFLNILIGFFSWFDFFSYFFIFLIFWFFFSPLKKGNYLLCIAQLGG